MNQNPFLQLATLTAHEATAPDAARKLDDVPVIKTNEPIERLFQASVKGVQTEFKHLSFDDIMYPPHQWFDAALARQIAIHVLNSRFDVPKRRIAMELVRSRAAVNRALEIVDGRLAHEDFAQCYELIVHKTTDALNDEGEA